MRNGCLRAPSSGTSAAMAPRRQRREGQEQRADRHVEEACGRWRSGARGRPRSAATSAVNGSMNGKHERHPEHLEARCGPRATRRASAVERGSPRARSRRCRCWRRARRRARRRSGEEALLARATARGRWWPRRRPCQRAAARAPTSDAEERRRRRGPPAPGASSWFSASGARPSIISFMPRKMKPKPEDAPGPGPSRGRARAEEGHREADARPAGARVAGC